MLATMSKTDNATISNLQQMCRQIKARLSTHQSKIDTHIQESQARLKSDYDRQVRETPSIQVGDNVFVDKPPLATSSRPSADAFANNTYNKLRQWTYGQYRILEVRAKTVLMDKCGIPNTVFIDRTTHESSPHTKYSRDEIPRDAKKLNADMQKARTASSTPHKANNADEYVNYKIVSSIGRTFT